MIRQDCQLFNSQKLLLGIFKMKLKLMQAFEEVTDQATPPVTVDIDELGKEISGIDSEVGEVINQLQEINEATAISGSVDSVIDTVQTSVETEEGLDETSMALTSTAMEHFFDRLNFTGKKIRPSLAVENFSDASTRLSNTKQALENLVEFSDNLKKSLVVCQESFYESVNARFNKSNGQLEAVLSAVDHVSVEFDKKGPTDTAIPSGQWSKSLGMFTKDHILGKDVLERVKKVKHAFEEIGIAEVMKDLCSSADKIIEELGKENSNITTDGVLETKLSRFDKKAQELHNLLIAKGSDGGAGSEFKPLTKEEKNELISLIVAIGNEVSQFAKSWKKLSEKIDNIKTAAEKVEETQNVKGGESNRPVSGRVIGFLVGTWIFPILGSIIGYYIGKSKDIKNEIPGTPGQSESKYKKQAPGVKDKTNDTLQNIIEIDGELVKFCFAAVTYVEKSTK